jgi:uncharacterized phage protein (TIGR02218 family)
MSTYDERENERYEGQPIEGFRFVQGERVWLYTSADQEITLPIGVFSLETITRSILEHSKEDSGEQMEITLPVTNPVAALFIGDVPSSPVWVTVYRAHRGDEAETVTIYSGKITRARYRGSEAILVGTSVGAMMTRTVPVLEMQTPCNHVLYSEECGANPTACRDDITVTTVDGVTVTSNDFALQPDQWFRGGRLQTTGGEMRFIADHVGDTITLISPLPGLVSLDEVYAFWGCDHLEATCASKFGRLDSHLGWSRLPTRNPFTGGID